MIEFVHQLTKTSSFFDRVEISPLNVLDQSDFEHLLVVHLPDHHRNLVEPRSLRSSPAAFAGNDLKSVRIVRIRANKKRLNDPVPIDRGRELGEVVIVEVSSRLPSGWP